MKLKSQNADLWAIERAYNAENIVICGVDEAGRGPLAGDVYAGAAILPPGCELPGLDDSKKLSPSQRDVLYDKIRQAAVACAVGTATVAEIDALNILNATLLAMRRAVAALTVAPALLLIDGNVARNFAQPVVAVKGGDGLSASIAAASILAKVERDRYMARLDAAYPGYGFAKHKGYGTAEHIAAIERNGLCELHRRTFTKRWQNA